MKCVLDTTIVLKQLIATDGHKLAMTIGGKSLLDHHFDSMQQAGITSVFVLIEAESKVRGFISREAAQYVFTPTFLEIPKELIEAKKSLTLAESYLKEVFIYWPINRMVSADLLQLMVTTPINNHQLLSLLFTGKNHPQVGKNSIQITGFDPDKMIRTVNNQSSFGYDIGLYKCSPLVFKLIEKVSQAKGFSWKQLLTAMTRSGLGVVETTESLDWSIIESNEDIAVIESLESNKVVCEIDWNELDRKGMFSAFAWLAERIAMPAIKNYYFVIWLALFGLSTLCYLTGQRFFMWNGAILLAVSVALFPLFSHLDERIRNNAWIEPHGLLILRLAVIGFYTLSIFSAYGMGFWLAFAIVLVGVELFFVFKPIEIEDPNVEQIASSFLVHAAVCFVSAIITLPLVGLILFGLFSLSLASAKVPKLLKEIRH